MQKKHIHEVKKTTHVHYKGIFISIQNSQAVKIVCGLKKPG